MNEENKYFKKLEKKPFGIFKKLLCSHFYKALKNNEHKEVLEKARIIAGEHTEQKERLYKNNETLTHDAVTYFCESLLEMGKIGIHGISPTPNMCRAMAHTEITINGDMFKLPFNPFIIKLPLNDYGFNHSIIRVIDNELKIMLLDDKLPLIYLAHVPKLWDAIICSFPLNGDLTNLFSNENICKYSSKVRDLSGLIKISVNTILYMNTKKPEEITERNVDDSIKKIRVVKPETKIKEYGFIQDITIRTKNIDVSEAGNSEIKMSPHWRRGHWRTQHFGVGREKLKLIFIAPVFINPGLFKGDMSNTGANYK